MTRFLAQRTAARSRPGAQGDPLVIVSLPAARRLAGELARPLGVSLHQALIDRFPNGEIAARLTDELAGQAVVLVAYLDNAEALLEVFLTADAATAAGARQVILCAPRLPYTRSDKPHEGTGSVGIRMLARLIEAAAVSLVVSANVHSAYTHAAFRVPICEINLIPDVAAAALRGRGRDACVLVAPDDGRADAVSTLGEALGTRVGYLRKARRSQKEVVVEDKACPDLDGATVVLVDDEVCTARTVCSAARLVRQRGAREVVAAAVHPPLADGAIERLRDSPISNLFITDSVPVRHRHQTAARIEIVSVAPRLATALCRCVAASDVRDKGGCDEEEDCACLAREALGGL